MNNVVYIGGYANGRHTLRHVSKSLAAHFENVEVFTFSDSIKKPDIIKRAATEALLITHSAGALFATRNDIHPDKIIMINPPLPHKKRALFIRTLSKQTTRQGSSKNKHTRRSMTTSAIYLISAACELLAHPFIYVTSLPRIAQFHTVTMLLAQKDKNKDITVYWTKGDIYFQPTPEEITTLKQAGIPVHTPSGLHDEIILRSDAFVKQIIQKNTSAN
jgi:hypothetical protein